MEIGDQRIHNSEVERRINKNSRPPFGLGQLALILPGDSFQNANGRRPHREDPAAFSLRLVDEEGGFGTDCKPFLMQKVAGEVNSIALGSARLKSWPARA